MVIFCETIVEVLYEPQHVLFVNIRVNTLNRPRLQPNFLLYQTDEIKQYRLNITVITSSSLYCYHISKHIL